jgi:cytochrome c553
MSARKHADASRGRVVTRRCPEPMKRAYSTKKRAEAAAAVGGRARGVEPDCVAIFRNAGLVWKMKGPPVPALLDIRRKYLEEALAELRDGKRIDGPGIGEVIQVLEATLAGYDPRPSLGIAAKNGKEEI